MVYKGMIIKGNAKDHDVAINVCGGRRRRLTGL